MINDLLVISVRMSFSIISIAFILVLIPSFVVNSFSQSNSSLSNNSLSNASISDKSDDNSPSSFSSLSRSLAETNQSEEEPVPPHRQRIQNRMITLTEEESNN